MTNEKSLHDPKEDAHYYSPSQNFYDGDESDY